MCQGGNATREVQSLRETLSRLRLRALAATPEEAKRLEKAADTIDDAIELMRPPELRPTG